MNKLFYVLLLCLQVSIAHLAEPTIKNVSNSSEKNDQNTKISDSESKIKNTVFEKPQSLKYFNNLHVLNTLFNHEYWIWDNFGKNVTKNCAHDMKVYLNHLKAGNVLAIQMSDASGRYGGNALSVNDFWLGSKRLCEEVNEDLQDLDFNISQTHFSVARFMIKLQPLYPVTNVLYMGQCLPEACTKDDIKLILKKDPSAINLVQDKLETNTTDFRNVLEILEIRLVPDTYNIWKDHKFYFFCSIAATLIVLVVFATIYELYLQMNGYDINITGQHFDSTGDIKEQQNKYVVQNSNSFQMKISRNGVGLTNGNVLKFNIPVELEPPVPTLKATCLTAKLILCFAVGSNARSILSLHSHKESSFSCIHGLRMFSLVWTILGHTCIMMFTIGGNRITQALTAQKFLFQIVVNGTYAVDTFFFLSGFLVVALFLRGYKKLSDGKQEVKGAVASSLQWLSKTGFLIIYRFGRLTPVYMFILLFSEVGLKYAYNESVFAPNPDIIDHVTCEKYWWRNLLYINNWFPKSEICMIWSWFLANEMQFYVMAIILLMISIKHFKTAATILGGLLLSSWIISASLSLSHDYKYHLIKPLEAFDYLYEKPWNRVGAYIIGMMTGQIYDHFKKPPKVPRFMNVMLWALSMTVLSILVLGFWSQELPVILTSVLMSVGRTVWSAALIWILLSCCWGLAPFINGFLSYKAFLPLSRLTYCAYLLHPLLMAIFYHQLETPVPLQDVLIFAVYCGTVLITFFFALVFSLLLEVPMIRIMRLLIKK